MYCALHYSDVIMSAMVSQITSLTIVYLTVYSGADQRKHQSSSFTGLCAGNSAVTGEFPAQMACNAENVSIGWRHHDMKYWMNWWIKWFQTRRSTAWNCFIIHSLQASIYQCLVDSYNLLSSSCDLNQCIKRVLWLRLQYRIPIRNSSWTEKSAKTCWFIISISITFLI